MTDASRALASFSLRSDIGVSSRRLVGDSVAFDGRLFAGGLVTERLSEDCDFNAWSSHFSESRLVLLLEEDFAESMAGVLRSEDMV